MYSNEPPHYDSSFEYPQQMFWLRNKSNDFNQASVELNIIKLLWLLIVWLGPRINNYEIASPFWYHHFICQAPSYKHNIIIQ